MARDARICWPDASRLDGPALQFPALELQPGPLYSDAAKLAQLQRAEQAARANKAERDLLIERKGGRLPRYSDPPPPRGVMGGAGGVSAGRLQPLLPMEPPTPYSAARPVVSEPSHPGAHFAI